MVTGKYAYARTPPQTSVRLTWKVCCDQSAAIYLVLDKSLIRSGALVLTDLSIDDGSFAWKLCMDIVCLSYDGNLADAALIAAMGALMRLQLPGTRRVDDEIFLTEGEE